MISYLGILNVSVSTIDRLFRRNEIHMKQFYNVPFERNSEGDPSPVCRGKTCSMRILMLMLVALHLHDSSVYV